MAQTEQLFLIKNLDNNKYAYINRDGECKFTSEVEEANQYSYQEAEEALTRYEEDGHWGEIPSGYYQIEKVFKRS